MIFKITLLLFSFTSWAGAPLTLVVSGGSPNKDPADVNFRYYNFIQRLDDTLRSTQGSGPVILNQDQTWNIGDNPNTTLSHLEASSTILKDAPTDEGRAQYLARNLKTPVITGNADKKTLQLKLKEFSEQIKAGTAGPKVELFFTDHGQAPTDAKDPLTASVVLWGEVVTLRELQGMLQTFPKEAQIQLMGIQCYSGGLHSIARLLSENKDGPQICSAASSSWKIPTYSETTINPYGAGYLKAIKNAQGDQYPTDGKVSMLEAHIWAQKNDGLNLEANVSSLDFIDFYLNEGPYASTDPNSCTGPSMDLRCFEEELMKDKKMEKEKKLPGQSSWRDDIEVGAQCVEPPAVFPQLDILLPQIESVFTATFQDEELAQAQEYTQRQDTLLPSGLRQWIKGAYTELIGPQGQTLKAQVMTYYKNRDKLKKSYDNDLRKLKAGDEAGRKKLDDFFRSKLADLEFDHDNAVKKFMKLRHTANLAKKIKKFMEAPGDFKDPFTGNAIPKQQAIRNFEQALSCEGESI